MEKYLLSIKGIINNRVYNKIDKKDKIELKNILLKLSYDIHYREDNIIVSQDISLLSSYILYLKDMGNISIKLYNEVDRRIMCLHSQIKSI